MPALTMNAGQVLVVALGESSKTGLANKPRVKQYTQNFDPYIILPLQLRSKNHKLR